MPLFQPKGKLSLPTNLLRDKYLVNPFSILDGKSNFWMQKKLAWEDIIKDRSNNVRTYKKHNTPYRNALNYNVGYDGLERKNSTSSTFDPFLCEIMIKWFSKPGDTIYDPFAGGHVRGAMSGVLGRNYIGIDINQEQINANSENWRYLCNTYDDTNFGKVSWIQGTSEEKHTQQLCDMLLTCPPYYNLEIYSDLPDDISTCETYEEFMQRYRTIAKTSYECLNNETFAVIVVEELRDPISGVFYGFVPDTINAYVDAGFKYYNEMILENRVMSLGVRCPQYFDRSRKVGRHHQNVLVFFKGDPNLIENKFGRFEEI